MLTLTARNRFGSSSVKFDGGNLPPFPRKGELAAIAGAGVPGASGTLWDAMYQQLASSGAVKLDQGDWRIFAAWSEWVFCSHLGELGSWVGRGGGDSDRYGTELYRFDVATRAYSRLCDRADQITGGENRQPPAKRDPNFDWAWGEHIHKNGMRSPGVGHTYDQVLYIPPSAAGNRCGLYAEMTRTMVYDTMSYRFPHYFDLDQVEDLPVSERAWSRGTVENADGSPYQCGFYAGGDAPSWCWDSLTDTAHGGQGGQGLNATTGMSRVKFDPVARVFRDLGAYRLVDPIAPNRTVFTPAHYPVTLHDPRRNLIITTGLSSAYGENRVLRALVPPANDSGGPASWVELRLTGDGLAYGGYSFCGEGAGFAYADSTDEYYIKPASAAGAQHMLTITPPESDPLRNDWRVEMLKMPGDTIDSTDTTFAFTGKRVAYNPHIGCLMWQNQPAGKMWTYGV